MSITVDEKWSNPCHNIMLKIRSSCLPLLAISISLYAPGLYALFRGQRKSNCKKKGEERNMLTIQNALNIKLQVLSNKSMYHRTHLKNG